jgi:hypothetical protein
VCLSARIWGFSSGESLLETVRTGEPWAKKAEMWSGLLGRVARRSCHGTSDWQQWMINECYASYPISSSCASLMLLTYLICMTGPSLPFTGLTSDFATI